MQHILGASAEPQTLKLAHEWPTYGPQTNSKGTGKASSQLKCKRPETNHQTMHGASDKTLSGGANAPRVLLRLEELQAQFGCHGAVLQVRLNRGTWR
jgi:hypothetical protein